ncbi:MAG: N-acetylglucosaminyldiphosphoundecaprenol N-acetyl-beta-D-mannosaminyltransferase [Solirubrobacteraceae bacterium]|nr:N-acetylglucosaminyldiphosphoundecaprenol N-acetyl-beta-D-mannosaminyltransferase [Solirubrobacteraceae bacterium]
MAPRPQTSPHAPEPLTPVASSFATVPVLGMPLTAIDYDGTMEWMDAAVAARHRGSICVATVHVVVRSQDDPELRAAMLASSLIVPDGQPLVWAMNALGGAGLGDRVYGPELMDRYCARTAGTGVRHYLYGGRSQGALADLADVLRRRHPGLQIVGGHRPAYRDATPEEDEAIAQEINASGADVVWVGTGQPRQEKWMHRLRERLDAPVLIGVGAAFDFHAGLIPQAPSWMQRAGMEWAFRLAQEPRRLWRRYAHYNPRFVAGFARQYARQRRVRVSR